jgi:hypothetical protein
MRVIYPENEEVVHWCHKAQGMKGDIVSLGGKYYICISADHRTSEASMGSFSLWKEYLTKEQWMEKQERLNPNWKPSGSFKGNRNGNQNIARKDVSFRTPVHEDGGRIEGEEAVLPPEKLDRIYRAMLSMLVLEDSHKASLLAEWKSPVHDVSYLIDKFMIRSLPIPDKARFKTKDRFKNPTRKALVSKLLDLFGDLRGVPGFYLRSGTYWSDKPERERWTLAFGHGAVIYPCYNKDGYLYRLRVKDEYPDLKIKQGVHEAFRGQYGMFIRRYDNEGFFKCYFCPENGGKIEVDPTLAYGKANGKYKTFSSYAEKLVGDKVVNTMQCGTRSGVPYSLYTQTDDNWSVVIGTEGEKKSMVANAIKHCPCVDIAGVSCYSVIFKREADGKSLIDKLKEHGMKFFILCYDADKESNESVKLAEAELVAELRNEGVQPLIGHWKSAFDKGLDDILLAGLDMVVSPAN